VGNRARGWSAASQGVLLWGGVGLGGGRREKKRSNGGGGLLTITIQMLHELSKRSHDKYGERLASPVKELLLGMFKGLGVFT